MKATVAEVHNTSNEAQRRSRCSRKESLTCLKRLIILACAVSLSVPVAAEPMYVGQITPQQATGYGIGYGLSSLLSNWGAKNAQKRFQDNIEATYAPCLGGGSPMDELHASEKLLRLADNADGELSLRLTVMGLQCRVSVDESNFYARDIIKSVLLRDEALAMMVDNRTSNGTTLDLATNALTRIHKTQATIDTEQTSVVAPDPVERKRR